MAARTPLTFNTVALPQVEAVSQVSDDVIISFSLGEKVRLRGNDATLILVLSNG